MPVFVDTGAWFAYFVRRDPDHMAAVQWIKANRFPLLTTDFVLDELLTRSSHLPPSLSLFAPVMLLVSRVDRSC